MHDINVAVIGTGWCGGIRAKACAANPLVDNLHIAEINPERLAEIEGAHWWFVARRRILWEAISRLVPLPPGARLLEELRCSGLKIIPNKPFLI